MLPHKLIASYPGSNSRRLGSRGCRAESGLAFLELAIILAIFAPLIVGFVFVWLPNFSRRSTELMNALSSLGGCLVDPINLYRFAAGQPQLRDDFEDIVNQAVATCANMSEGGTSCGFVYDHEGAEVYRFGMNETPALSCANLDVRACVGRETMTNGLVIAFLLSDGTARCEFVPGSDPGEEPIRGDESHPSGGGGGTLCDPAKGYYEVLCLAEGGPLPESPPGNPMFLCDYICCKDGTVFDGTRCLGCPTGGHLCVGPSDGVNYCVRDDNPRWAGGACFQAALASGPLVCSTNEIVCASPGVPSCCPSTDTCANWAANSYVGCIASQPPAYFACYEGYEGTAQIPFHPNDGCNMMVHTIGPGRCGSQQSGDVVMPPDKNKC